MRVRDLGLAVAGLMLLLGSGALAQSPPGGAGGGAVIPQAVTVAVDCGAGETITDALQTAAVELTVEFSGVCTENVSIDRERTILRGLAGGVIEGGVTIFGVTRVVLEDFTVMTGGGVRARDGSSVSIARVTSQDTAGLGFRIEGASQATLTDVTALRNTFAGVAALDSSTIAMFGNVVASESTVAGIFLNTSASVSSRAAMTTDDNGFAGIAVQLSSTIQANGSWSASRNPVGLFAVDGSSVGINSATLVDNTYGVSVSIHSIAELSGVTVDGGGVEVTENSTLRLNSSTVMGAPHPDFVPAGVSVGVSAQASHVRFGGPTTIDGSLQLFLGPGGQGLTFEDPAVLVPGGILCDPTAIAYGNLSC